MKYETLDEWLKALLYLPPVLRDFHDQKRLFKRINVDVEHKMPQVMAVSWIRAHIYVIDFFLHYMARHGYTLQRIRVDLPFADLESDIAQFIEQDMRRSIGSLMIKINTSQTRTNPE